MPTPVNSNTFSQTYKDDWEQDSSFHKVLFNSGKSLQARELTQLQTIIQNEITRFGKNIFKDGAAVSSGRIEIDNNYRYVRLTGTGAENLVVGALLTGQTSNVTAKVLEVVSTISGEARVYVRYTGGGGAALVPGTNEKTFGEENVTSGLNTYRVGVEGSYLLTDTGAGVKITVEKGDFFAAGRFVHSPRQSIILSPTSRNYTGIIGFKIVQDVWTVNDSPSLYDNSGSTPNISAPGADRWRIRLVLIDKDDLDTGSDSFIFLAKIINSKIVEVVDEIDAYNKIENLLAKRTFEESGNYLAEPFKIHFEDTDATDVTLDLIVSPGIAYVKGFRVENEYPIRLQIPRPQATETITGDFVPVSYGSYVITTNNVDGQNFGSSLGERIVTMWSGTTGNSTALGSCAIRTVERSGSVIKVYLADIQLGSNSFISVKSIGTGPTDYFELALVSGAPVLYEAHENTSLYELPRSRPFNVSDVKFNYQKGYAENANSGTITVSGNLSANEAYVNSSDWVVTNSSGVLVDPSTYSIDISAGDAFTITSLDDTENDHYITTIVRSTKTTGVRKSKTVTEGTVTTTLTVDLDGYSYVDLGQYDIYNLVEVKQTNNAGVDLSSYFDLDNGQRDTHYEKGRLILKTGQSVSGTIYVKFNYFAHGSGKFFDVGSYSIDYTEIPDHRMANGQIVSLRDFIDFRGKKTTTYIETQNPVQGSSIQANISYYLSRADKLLVNEDGEFSVLLGQQSQEPQFKKTPDNSLELYKIVMNPNTISTEDINTTFIEHKRYTMADIAKLERKLDKLEEMTTLSFLELEAKLNPSLDGDGNPRTETGIHIDDLTDQTGSDTQNPDYNASLDPENNIIRPSFDGENLRLIYREYDGSNADFSSANVSVKGDNVYINHTNSPWISQPLASHGVQINPTDKVDFVGNLTLSPSSDEWKSAQRGTRVLTGGKKLDTEEAFLYNSWQWNWTGRSSEDLEIQENAKKSNNRDFGAFGRKELLRKKQNVTARNHNRTTGTGGHVSRVVSSETIRTVNAKNRVLDAAITPWIRSREISFKATGLKPNTQFVPFFDGIDVSDWCKQKEFVRWSNSSVDIGNQGSGVVTKHPENIGAGPFYLLSGSNGELSGSFYIPNIRPTRVQTTYGLTDLYISSGLRFKTGKKEFKLLDVTVNDHNQAGSMASAIYDASGMVDTRKNGHTTTRPPKKGRSKKITKPYNSSELQQLLNSVVDTDVKIIDPQQSGFWGGEISLGVSLPNVPTWTVLSDYISVDQNKNAGTSVFPDQDVSHPFAQSFKVDNQFGVVLTSVDIYFKNKDDNLDVPVTLEIRPLISGKPSNDAIPGSDVTVDWGNIQVPAANSNTPTTATNFEFEEPVFLDPGQEYVIVLSTQSSNYYVWISESGRFVAGSDNQTIHTQSANGQLYLPTTSSAAASKEMDLAYVLNRAVFETNASLVLRNAAVPFKLLEKDPLVITGGSDLIYVKHPCHGLDVGETAEITVGSVSAGTYGGTIPHTALEGTHTVTAIDGKGYQFNCGVQASAGFDEIGGGSEVKSDRNIHYATANPQIESVLPNKTSIDVVAKFTNGKSVSDTSVEGLSSKFTKADGWRRINPGVNMEFNSVKIIAQRTQELSQSDIVNKGGYSVDFKVDLKSSSDFVSPIVDLQRCSMILVQNCIDDPVALAPIIDVDETEPYGGTSSSKHISTPIEVAEPSRSLEIKVDANVPPAANLDFYYRTAMTGGNILDQRWILAEPTTTVPKDKDPSVSRQIKINPGGLTGTLAPFTQSQTKVVMRSTNAVDVPTMSGITTRVFLK